MGWDETPDTRVQTNGSMSDSALCFPLQNNPFKARTYLGVSDNIFNTKNYSMY